MRAVLGLALIASLASAPVLACDFHDGGGYAYTGYDAVVSDTELAAREARIAAEREQAMVEARSNFLARFDIKAEDTLQVASAETSFPKSADADRSARADSPDR